MENNIEKLTELQKTLGYKKQQQPDNVNTVAMLGLFGEAGEVMAEVTLVCAGRADELKEISALKNIAVGGAILIDNLKKKVRKSETSAPVETWILDTVNFDEELADTLYYLNILALNRGKTLNDYAQMAIEKVERKGLKHEPAKS